LSSKAKLHVAQDLQLSRSDRVDRKPTWGTCAGLILLAEAANVTSAKKGGQELIGGLDVRVNRNHFGRQVESFTAPLYIPFLSQSKAQTSEHISKDTIPFPGVFIRAPIVEKILPHYSSPYATPVTGDDSVAAPSKVPASAAAKEFLRSPVEILVTLPGRVKGKEDEAGDVVAVKQGNVFGTSFHPELTTDWRIHAWWLDEVAKIVERRQSL
jgi:5'-phosphate synthase pdxT subunit